MTMTLLRTSMRLGLRSAWFWSVALLSLLLAYFFIHTDVGGVGVAGVANLFYRPGEVGMWTHLFVLGLMLAVVAEAHQDRQVQAGEGLEALPYQPAAWVAGRVGGLWLLWLGVGTLAWVLALFVAVVRTGQPLDGYLFWGWLWLFPATTLFATAAAYAIGARFRSFGAYGLTMLLFFFGSFSGMQLLSKFSLRVFAAGPATPFDFMLVAHLPVATSWPFPDGWPLLYNRLFAVAAGVWLAAGVARTLAGRRRDPAALRRTQAVRTTAVVLVVLSLLLSRGVWMDRMAQLWAEEAAYGSAAPRGAAPGPAAAMAAPAVSGYNVHLRLDPELPGLEGSAIMDLPAPGETAAFTLNRIFQVTAVTGPEGAPVPFDRHGDLLLVHPQRRPGRYTVAYGGTVWQWRTDNWSGMRLGAHVAEQSVMLPTSLGWYPLPGLQTLAVRERTLGRLVNLPVSHPPVPFRLQVEGAGGLRMLSNTTGGATRGAWVIGTPYTGRQAGGVTIYTEPFNAARAEAIGSHWGKRLAFYQQLVPLSTPPVMVEVPAALEAGAQNYLPMAGYTGAVLLSTRTLAVTSDINWPVRVINLWWSGARTAEEEQVHDVLGQFMLDLYDRQHAESRGTVIFTGNWRQNGATTPEGRELLSALHSHAERYGPEGAGALLRTLHGTEAPLTFGQVQAAVRAAAVAKGGP